MYNKFVTFLNIVLFISIILLFIYIGWNVYELNKEVVKYNAPEFEEGKGVQELLKYEAPLDGLIQIQTKENFSGLLKLKITSLKHFKIDWGNGSEVNYSGSAFSQILPPVLYTNGTFDIKIRHESDTIISLDVDAPNNFESISIQNSKVPETLLPNYSFQLIADPIA